MFGVNIKYKEAVYYIKFPMVSSVFRQIYFCIECQVLDFREMKYYKRLELQIEELSNTYSPPKELFLIPYRLIVIDDTFPTNSHLYHIDNF